MYLSKSCKSKTELYLIVNNLLKEKYGLSLVSVKFLDNDIRNLAKENIIKVNQYN